MSRTEGTKQPCATSLDTQLKRRSLPAPHACMHTAQSCTALPSSLVHQVH